MTALRTFRVFGRVSKAKRSVQLLINALTSAEARIVARDLGIAVRAIKELKKPRK